MTMTPEQVENSTRTIYAQQEVAELVHKLFPTNDPDDRASRLTVLCTALAMEILRNEEDRQAALTKFTMAALPETVMKLKLAAIQDAMRERSQQ